MTLGVDPDSGEPIRGRGRGFEQDILVFDAAAENSHTSVVPRIVAEVKFSRVNTHDVIVYSEKADRIRRVYPYVRYGFILGGMRHIPPRVLRLGQRFDFIAALPADLSGPEFTAFAEMIRDEAATFGGSHRGAVRCAEADAVQAAACNRVAFFRASAARIPTGMPGLPQRKGILQSFGQTCMQEHSEAS